MTAKLRSQASQAASMGDRPIARHSPTNGVLNDRVDPFMIFAAGTLSKESRDEWQTLHRLVPEA